MTTKQLYDDIRSMGFDRRNTNSEADAERVFTSAVNRAQETLATLFPLYEQVTLAPSDFLPCMEERDLHLGAHEKKSLSAENARAYALSVRGSGVISVFANGLIFARHRVDSLLTFHTFSGNLLKNSALTLTLESGDESLLLRGVRVYDLPSAPLEKQGAFTVYRLDALAEGGVSLDTPPVDQAGYVLKENQDYRVENGLFYLSDRIAGALTLTVRRTPRRFDMGEEAPDVREECAHLLPLLTASYAWLDDDREKALFYLAMYRESLARTVKNGRTAGVSGGYRTENGW